MAAVGSAAGVSSKLAVSSVFIPSKKIDLSVEDRAALEQVIEMAKDVQKALVSSRSMEETAAIIKWMVPQLINAEIPLKGGAEHFFKMIVAELEEGLVST